MPSGENGLAAAGRGEQHDHNRFRAQEEGNGSGRLGKTCHREDEREQNVSRQSNDILTPGGALGRVEWGDVKGLGKHLHRRSKGQA